MTQLQIKRATMLIDNDFKSHTAVLAQDLQVDSDQDPPKCLPTGLRMLHALGWPGGKDVTCCENLLVSRPKITWRRHLK